MKIRMTNGVATFTPENENELRRCLEIGTSEKKNEMSNPRIKRRSYQRTCSSCGKKCNGKMGLSVHQSWHAGKLHGRPIKKEGGDNLPDMPPKW